MLEKSLAKVLDGVVAVPVELGAKLVKIPKALFVTESGHHFNRQVEARKVSLEAKEMGLDPV